MKKIKIALWITLLAFLVFLSIYGDDNYYLKLRSADKAWSYISLTLDEIVRKGDLVEYEISPEQNDPLASIYEKRFLQQIEVLNKKNSPSVLNTYTLKTLFVDIEGVKVVEFEIKEKSTEQLIEKKNIQVDYIKAKSIIPGVVALFGSILTTSPLLFILGGLWLGASINVGNSFILGLHDTLFKYIPYSLTGNNYAGFKIAIFFFCLMFVLRILSRSGATKMLSEDKSIFRFIPFVLSIIHPYIFISLGAWWFNSINKNKQIFNSEFPFQTIGLAFQPLILISPFLIPLMVSSNPIGDNAQTLTMRFASFALIITSACYILLSNKSSKSIPLPEIKPGLKKTRTVAYTTILMAIAPLPLSLIGFNVNSVLMLSGMTALLCSIFFSTRTKLLSSYEILTLAWESFTYSFKYLLYILSALALGKVLYDLGTIHYMISVFSVDPSSHLFYVALFLSSLISSAFMGGCLVSVPLLIASFLPLMGYNSDVTTAILCIVEGSILGELVCPYSPSTIISSAIYRTNPSKHVFKQLPYLGIALLSASIAGFWAYGLGVPKVVSYIVIVMAVPIVILASKNHKKRQIKA